MSVIIDTPVSSRGHGEALTELTSNEDFLGTVLGTSHRFHHSSRDKLYFINMPTPVHNGSDEIRNRAAYRAPTVSLAIQAVHQAYSAHVPVSLRPDTLWYFIVHEVAEHVRQNADVCAPLFTDTPGSKQTIVVRDDTLRPDAPSDWQRAINLVREPLAAKITERTAQLFLPHFSTSTSEDETALLIALMDVVSPYYAFEWHSMCGIPRIRLEGTPADWRSLYDRTERLAGEFGGLRDYFAELLPVLQTIAETAGGATPDEWFWSSIYKVNNMSGGPYVNGWLTAFFAHFQVGTSARPRERFDWTASRGWLTNEFPSHVSTVPFVWDYAPDDARYDMAFVAGVTGVDYDDDTFLSPRLGFAVAELRKK